MRGACISWAPRDLEYLNVQFQYLHFHVPADEP